MRVDSMHIAGINGIEVPDGTQVDDEFTLSVRVKVFAMERDQIDVSTYGKAESMPGALDMKLIAVDGPSG